MIIGGLLVTISWRAVFLVSVPIGILGTVWAYLMLHESAKPRRSASLDIPGNVLFAGGLTSLLVALTYGIQPYGGSNMGWTNPWVIAGIAGGVLLLIAFVVVELKVDDPMFRLELFRNRSFAMNNVAGFLASVARGGLQFMIIIWLQGVWLPLHGYSFEKTPLWAGIYMIPLTVGFLAIAPVGGILADRYGARELAALGMVITAAGFFGLTVISADFSYPVFAALLLVLGIGMGLFTAPNTTAIMNAVPAAYRGVASGMRATFQNVANTLSITVIFSLVTVGLASHLPDSLQTGLTAAGIPTDVATKVADLPPVGALFAAFLGYNPLQTLISPETLANVSEATRTTVLSTDFFPSLLSAPFKDGVQLRFLISALLSLDRRSRVAGRWPEVRPRAATGAAERSEGGTECTAEHRDRRGLNVHDPDPASHVQPPTCADRARTMTRRGTEMAVAMLMRWNGVTPEQYDQAKAIVGWEHNPAPGGIFHIAGFDEHGLHCADVWESANEFNAFVADRLMPGVQQVGIQGQPEVEIVPVHDLFAPGYVVR